MSERTGPDQAFQLRPSVKLLERSDAAVPGCGGDARTGILAPACTMERIDIRARGGPDRLAASGVQKPDPHRDVIAVGAQRVGRAHAVQRQVKEEAVEVGVVGNAVAENDRNVAVETFRRSTLLDGDVRNRRLVIHRLFNLPPDPHPDPGINRGVLPGPALSRPASASYVGALRPAWITPPRPAALTSAGLCESVQTVKIRREVLPSRMTMIQTHRSNPDLIGWRDLMRAPIHGTAWPRAIPGCETLRPLVTG